MIVLHTLGDTLITIGDRKIRPSSPLVFASLLYLATERGRRVPRTALQEMLFPNAGERSGAHSLRQLLYKLRQLGAPLEADATSVYLAPDHVRDDAVTTSVSHSPVVSFLPDFEPDISERYSEWLERKRAEFGASIRKRLVASIETNREALNWQAVERDAQLLLSVDPFNEVGTFALAEAVALSGGKAAAMRILSEYERETGRTDLRLPASLLRRRISQAVPDTPVPTLSALPFVGRDAEVMELRKYIARARAGQPCLYVIGGEAGIGKTRLLTEVAALAGLEGMAVFTVRCQPHYASRPMSVFIELVPALRAAPGALGVSPQSLASLNSLTRHTDTEDASPDSRDDVTRSELMLGAIRDLVDAVASEQPLLIAVEDAHWADRDSLRELNRWIQGGSDHALVIVCTSRTPESFPHSPSLDDRTLSRRLRPLASDAIGQLAERLLPKHRAGDPGDLVAWSIRMCGGNPLLLQMLCSHYTSTGKAYEVPPDVLTAVTKRIEQLPANSTHVLALCALLGKHATIEVLRHLTKWHYLQLSEAFRLLEEHGYVALLDDNISVTHDLLGQAALAIMPPLSRRIMHAGVANELQHHYDRTNDAGLLWDCAEQWVLSGVADKAIASLQRCARHAVTIGRANDALKHLSRSLELVRYQNEKAPILGEMLAIAAMASLWDQAELVAREYDQFELVLPAGLHTDAEIAAIDVDWQTGRHPARATERAQNCISSTSASVDHRVAAARMLLSIAHEQCDSALAESTFAQVQDLIDRVRATYSHRLVPIYYHSVFGTREIASDLLEQLIVDIQRFPIHERMRAAQNVCATLGFLGAYNRIVVIASEHYELASSLGASSWRFAFCQLVCAGYVLLEDFQSATKWYALSTREGLARGSGRPASIHAANAVEIAIASGDAKAADDAFSAAASSQIPSRRWDCYLKGLRARVQLLDADYQLPKEDIDDLLDAYEGGKRFASCDGLVFAVCEIFRRSAKAADARVLLADYASVRRERCPLPPSLQTLISKLQLQDTLPVARQVHAQEGATRSMLV